MKVSIVGAGPAGLYLGILLKKADPAHEIEIVERNASDATFGWGVVFSDQTLGALRDADLQTHIDITDTFARWDAVDVRYRSELLRSRGHAFAGIARRQLLAILQRRCHELGVKLEFGLEVDDPDAVDGDLVVAADGVNSVFRRSYADEFGSVVQPQGCKYVWFGTDLVLDAFRFIFKQTQHGVFQVHSYPFDEQTSTFIVECPEQVWRSAGLDQMDEDESIAFCEELFAEDLGGHILMSNRSIWLDFLKVRNKTWRLRDVHRHVVLLGDAAHTAHFSIGSGTKLAMDDAIALANACVRHSDAGSAAMDYELERQPMVERVQQAADDSAAYFARVSRLLHLEPRQFAFNLLTRSGRISHAGLSVRDPEFVRHLDSWFAGAPSFAPPPVFAPLTIGGVTIRNRTVFAVTAAEVRFGPHGLDALTTTARRGPGLILVDRIAVTADGRITPDDPTPDDLDVKAWQAAIEQIHDDDGSAVMLRIGHAGRRGAAQPRDRGVDLPLRADGWPLTSASPLRYGPFGRTPSALTEQGMADIRDAFVTAAVQAADAGFDALELDAAQGYLLASFLSPLSNQRDDQYGGSLAHRMRFPLEVVKAVRAVWPDDNWLAVRIPATDWARGGLTPDDGVDIARAMAAAGAGLIHVTAGQTVATDRPEYRRGYLTKHADRIRTEARVPTLVGGFLTTLDEVNTIVAAGRADLCVLELAS